MRLVKSKKKKLTQEQIVTAGKKRYDVVDGKQIIGHARICAAGQEPLTVYHLEDGTQHIEDDSGKKLQKANVQYTRRKADVKR